MSGPSDVRGSVGEECQLKHCEKITRTLTTQHTHTHSNNNTGTENKLRRHFDNTSEIPNSNRVHCRLCKLERVEGYLQNAFKGFASKDYFLGEFSGASGNNSPLPLTPTSLTASSYDLCSSPQFNDSFVSMHSESGHNSNMKRGRSSFFSRMASVGSSIHRRMSSKRTSRMFSDASSDLSDIRLRKRVSSRSTDIKSSEASSSGRFLRHRATGSSQGHLRSRVSSSLTSRDSFESTITKANPGVGYYIWSVVCKLDRTSRASGFKMPIDMFSRVVISQTVPRICAFLIFSENKEEKKKKKKKVFPKRTWCSNARDVRISACSHFFHVSTTRHSKCKNINHTLQKFVSKIYVVRILHSMMTNTTHRYIHRVGPNRYFITIIVIDSM